jgi:hypothetical protein
MIAGHRWLNGVQARAILGMEPYQFAYFMRRHADHITTQRYPGCRPRYSEADLKRLVAESIKPATAK